MLSITKINSAANQSKKGKDGGYLHYLGGPSTTTQQRGDFDDYARGDSQQTATLPTWACSGAALLGLSGVAQPEQVERLAKGLHPLSGAPLVKGAGAQHVMGLDMTFSAPKDVSAIFAGADAATRDAVAAAVMDSAKTALAHVEPQCVTRHGKAGAVKRLARAAVAACYPHFASRAGAEPQLHVHGFLFNVGKRDGAEEWSALEQRAQFERKMSTGILFRAELASRMKALGFHVEPDGPYFTIRGIDQTQRDALSTRSLQIAQYLREHGMPDTPAAREVAALNTRQAKAEPPLPELLEGFAKQAAAIGLTPASIAAMRAPSLAMPDPGASPFALDHDKLMERLMESQSCATCADALAAICEMAMGQWSAAECLAELSRFLDSPLATRLGQTEQLAEVFTSKATLANEAECSNMVERGAADAAHRLDPALIDQAFDRLEAEISAKIGAPASLAQQRAAAGHVACETGRHAFAQGWAGAGKTTMLKALGEAYKASGFEVLGCCQSAAASQNLSREAGIPSRTIASLLYAVRQGKARLGPKTILVLDEAGMVGSQEFSALQRAVIGAGGKLVAVGDSKQLQPIAAGGIFRALCERHGHAEISNIQRQRTDPAPLIDWLESQGALGAQAAETLRKLPQEAKLAALESMKLARLELARGFEQWRERYDHEWMRDAVRMCATGQAREALSLLDERGRLKLISGHEAALDRLISDWAADPAPMRAKTMIAGARVEVAALNAKARALLISTGQVRDARGVEVDIVHRDGSLEAKRFAPGDRIVFTKNDRDVGVANGAAGTIVAVERAMFTSLFRVELDDPNARGETAVMVPPSFGRFDHAYCLTNHKSQGRTFDSAYCLVNPSMADREWSYVVASRSRFATTLYVDLEALAPDEEQDHGPFSNPAHALDREAALERLGFAMSRERAKGTSLDWASPAEKGAFPALSADAPALPSQLGQLASARDALNVAPINGPASDCASASVSLSASSPAPASMRVLDTSSPSGSIPQRAHPKLSIAKAARFLAMLSSKAARVRGDELER